MSSQSDICFRKKTLRLCRQNFKILEPRLNWRRNLVGISLFHLKGIDFSKISDDTEQTVYGD